MTPPPAQPLSLRLDNVLPMVNPRHVQLIGPQVSAILLPAVFRVSVGQSHISYCQGYIELGLSGNTEVSKVGWNIGFHVSQKVFSPNLRVLIEFQLLKNIPSKERRGRGKVAEFWRLEDWQPEFLFSFFTYLFTVIRPTFWLGQIPQRLWRKCRREVFLRAVWLLWSSPNHITAWRCQQFCRKCTLKVSCGKCLGRYWSGCLDCRFWEHFLCPCHQ